jgi:3-hydroxyacyl-[acyl-carrier-protein] dehydratase
MPRQDQDNIQQDDHKNIQGDSVGFQEIIQLIPHRYPFLLVDKVVNMFKNTSAVGIKNVTINEPFFQGHFPKMPVMPGVLIVEAMAQTAGILVVHSMNQDDAVGVHKERVVYFMSIEGAKFRKPVGPGDRLEMKVTALHGRRNVWKFKGEAFVEGKLVAEAQYTAMIVDQE